VSEREKALETCVNDLLTFAAVYAERYARESNEGKIHPFHAEIVDRACTLLGRPTISAKLCPL